jgi:GNAT superfamily N-acetyltransferase
LVETVRIRPARVDDLPALADLAFRSKAVWGYDAGFMEACRAELTLQAADLTRGAVAVIDGPQGRPVAMVEVVPQGSIAALHKVFVDPEHLGQGLGRHLMDWATRTARAMGAAALEFDADPGAAAFYERIGATKIGDSPSGSIPGRFIPRYRLDL